MFASITSRGAVAVYGTVATTLGIVQYQREAEARRKLYAEFLAEQGKVTSLSCELKATKLMLQTTLEAQDQQDRLAGVEKKLEDHHWKHETTYSLLLSGIFLGLLTAFGGGGGGGRGMRVLA
jgi:Skp family chaperone for outer membrane proteins